MYLTVLVGSVILRSQQTDLIGIPITDAITVIHVESVLKRHHIRYASGEDLGFCEFYFTDLVPRLWTILEKEAPPKEFPIIFDKSVERQGKAVAHLRRDLGNQDLARRWTRFSALQLLGTSKAPFSMIALCNTEAIETNTVTEVEYVRRPYLGPDLKRHIGFDVKLVAGGHEKRYQILDQDGSQVVIGLQRGELGPKALKITP